MYDPSHNWLKISLDKDTKPYSPNIVMTSSVTLTWLPQNCHHYIFSSYHTPAVPYMLNNDVQTPVYIRYLEKSSLMKCLEFVLHFKEEGKLFAGQRKET